MSFWVTTICRIVTGTALVLRQDKEFGVVVVDLAKDPLAAGPLARSTTRDSNLDNAIAARVFQSL